MPRCRFVLQCNFRLICILKALTWHSNNSSSSEVSWATTETVITTETCLYSVKTLTNRLIALDYSPSTRTHTERGEELTHTQRHSLNMCFELISFLRCYCKTHAGHTANMAGHMEWNYNRAAATAATESSSARALMKSSVVRGEMEIRLCVYECVC